MAEKVHSKPKRTLAEIRKIRSEAGKKGAAARIISLRENSGKEKVDVAKLIKDAEREAGDQFYMRAMRGLRQAQVALAKGVTFLYVIRTDKKGNRSKPEIVTDQFVIEQYLADELDNDDEEYFFLATKEPNNEALKDIQNRVFGKPKDDNALLGLQAAFSLLELARRSVALAPINGNADITAVKPLLPHPVPPSEN